MTTRSPVSHWLARVARAALLGATSAGLLSLAGCDLKKALWQSGFRIPDVLEKPMEVKSVVPRGDYLEATLSGGDFSIEVYLPSDDACRTIFVEGAVLNFLEGSPGGIYQRDDWICRSAGIGTLIEWRSRYPRPRTTGSIIARGLASYQLVYQDDQVAFLRGRFPLTGRLGFAGLGDTIAVVEKTPECEAPIARTRSSMEYYPVGEKVFTLVSTRSHCLITGLITPFGKGRPESDS